jgi:hypothetical protein
MSDLNPDVKPDAANVSAAPSGGQPAPEATGQEANPTPGEGGSSTDVKQVPLQALQEERGKRQEAVSNADQLSQELAELRRVVSEGQQQQQSFQQQQQQQQPQVDPRVELDKVWEDDPKQAVRMEIMYAMDWRDRQDSNLEIQADALARKYPDFNNHRSAALGQVRSLPLNQRGGEGILEASYLMSRGQNVDSLMQAREQELLEKYRRGELNAEGLATPPGSYGAPSANTGVQATDDQMKTASMMGLTTEQYMSAVVNK